ncbi:hypothetical protein [Mesorhizobium delmotii]|uniref:Uncharacterized protein n=1 Tax=Mesorhizobium delmotii TaxID=1631247 RepID=A0A2P9AM71_9HYPH|nr:hypothetical protein [Mesorhizobium delmotii]SJM32232.1 hypothetical protein BQ8482_250117 [Mesorhizobium delmotii]
MAENTSESYPRGPVLSRREALQAGAGALGLTALPSQSGAAATSSAKETSTMTRIACQASNRFNKQLHKKEAN